MKQSFFRELQNGVEGKFIGYKIKNKKETIRKYLIGWSHIANLVWVRKPRVCLVFGGWLTECTVFLVKWSIYRDMKVT